MWGGEGTPGGFWLGNLRQRGHWEDPDVDGGKILKWIFMKQDGGRGVD